MQIAAILPTRYRMRTTLSLAVAVLLCGCTPPGGFKITAVPSDQSLKERVVIREPGWVSNRIAVIDISGVLTNARSFGLLSEGEHVVSFVVEKLHKAASDKRVKGIILRINSPGGTVTASDILYEEIVAFKQKTGKPVVAYFQDVAASGAYYLACAADEIMAQRTSITGSIGVIMQMVDVSGTLAKLGISADAVKSGSFKDAGSPFRKMSVEERDIFQGLVDGFYQQFLSVVTAGRPKLGQEEVVKLADGRVYTASQALKSGLIDRIGTLQQAVETVKERAGIETAHVVIYGRPLAWSPNIYARYPTPASTTINLLNLNVLKDWTRRPSFMYIWGVQ